MKKITIFKIGNNEHPATNEDIECLSEQLGSRDKSTRHFTFHHAVKIEWIELRDNETLIAFVGNNEKPATDEDIKEVDNELIEIFKSNAEKHMMVTHHGVKFSVIENF